MDSLGDYIYIVIIAIAALSSIFKKKKKKEKQPAPETGSDSSSDDFEELLRELLPQKNTPPVVQPEAITEKKAKASNTIISYENTTDFSQLKAKKHVNRQPTENQIRETEKLTLERERSAENLVTIQTPEDARKAFIYAEIFNRKY